jgi:hypothetical protein
MTAEHPGGEHEGEPEKQYLSRGEFILQCNQALTVLGEKRLELSLMARTIRGLLEDVDYYGRSSDFVVKYVATDDGLGLEITARPDTKTLGFKP